MSCGRTVNNKIKWTSHSSFVHITCGNIILVSNVRREVDEVREERLRRRARQHLEERETSEKDMQGLFTSDLSLP